MHGKRGALNLSSCALVHGDQLVHGQSLSKVIKSHLGKQSTVPLATQQDLDQEMYVIM